MVYNRQQIMGKHLAKHGDCGQLAYRLSTLENENAVVPRRCPTCNWVLFGSTSHPGSCQAILNKVEKFMDSGEWEKVEFLPSFR